jgi:hypothetical protein
LETESWIAAGTGSVVPLEELSCAGSEPAPEEPPTGEVAAGVGLSLADGAEGAVAGSGADGAGAGAGSAFCVDPLPVDPPPVVPSPVDPLPVEPPPLTVSRAPVTLEVAAESAALVSTTEPPPDEPVDVGADTEVVSTPGRATAKDGSAAASKKNAATASAATAFRLRSP